MEFAGRCGDVTSANRIKSPDDGGFGFLLSEAAAELLSPSGGSRKSGAVPAIAVVAGWSSEVETWPTCRRGDLTCRAVTVPTDGVMKSFPEAGSIAESDTTRPGRGG